MVDMVREDDKVANYVHNYIFCDIKAKERMMNLSSDDLCMLMGCYDKIVTKIENDKFLIIFDNRGIEYRTEFIISFIKEFHDAIWYCIEENEIEQGCFLWNGSNVIFSKRRLFETLNGKEICIKYSDSEHRPLRIIFISDSQITFENIIKNEMKSYHFSEKTNLLINEYINYLLDKESEEFIEHLFPLKGGIRRFIGIYWGNKTYYIESVKETNGCRLNVGESEYLFYNLISSFNSFLRDEGIEEVVSFTLIEELRKTIQMY